jgi:hypothetical protein
MTPKSFDYDEMVQKALKTVVKETLKFSAENGLPGGHHFYITFQTNRPDVKLPQYLIDKHPEEITIVLQHQFWNLAVDEDGFEVSLSFNDVHERIRVAFDALISFLDPYVKFGLQFTPVPPTVIPTKAKGTKKKGEPHSEKASNVITLDSFRKK